MKKLLDSLYYQYVLDDQDKASGTVFEDVSGVSRKDKVLGLLSEHAGMVGIAVALYNNLQDGLDEGLNLAFSDKVILENAEDDDEIIQAVQDTPEIQDLYDAFEQAEQELVEFEEKLATAVSKETV